MSKDFYSSEEYKEKQSLITKQNWEKGTFNFCFRREKRMCARIGCGKIFEVKKSDPKIYCSKSCSAKVNNVERGSLSAEVKLKISKALAGRKNPNWCGGIKVPRVEIKCEYCGKIFLIERWMKRRFCSNKCAMAVIGGNPTSPKAARGKAGIRSDIDKTTYFYSRWEANFARLLNYWEIEWVHQPKVFDLGTQKYTPDFYLPQYDIYIEIKNFLWNYSRIRDEKFRKLYPNKKLILLLKEDYLKFEKRYSDFIPNWEYKNSPFVESG